MQFNKVFTEELYNNHLLWLNNSNIGGRLVLSHANLSDVDLCGANLSRVDLSRANLSGAYLSCVDLSRADLSRANLSGADLSGANLSSADLSRANLSGANLSGANLSDVDLSGANLSRVDLSRANLSGANLSGANLSNIKFNYCIGNNKEIKNLPIPTYHITFCNNILAIGCKQYTIDEWYNFTDDEIDRMDINALIWCDKYKDFIEQWIEISA